ncbi:MAG: sigma-70 family RNA polymerase sigma factor [Sphingobacteriia bacterium]|nr:sigma-70 family RNA polymerase sigma factor [Sphingobacteriia bacterium]
MIDEEYEIIRRIQQGQVNDFEILVIKYQSAVFKLLINMLHNFSTAEELTQDVFVKAYEHLGKFNFNSRFFSWLYRIAINDAISYNQKKKNWSTEQYIPESPEKSAEEIIIADEKQQVLNHCIHQLTEKNKAVIILKYYEHLSYEEIAEVLSINEEKVKSRLFEARKALKNLLEQNHYF